jgi:hypothetical protein
MKQPLHILALLLFALTQFVAPFAHAHVDGIHGDSSIHTSDMPRHLHLPGLSQCHIESHESQAVGPQQEYPRDDASIIPASSFSAVQPMASGNAIYISRINEEIHPPTSAYHRPHPQAPPA